MDHYLTNREAASARVFRVYKPTPPHYHATCDEYLYVFSGRGTFWIGDESTSAEFGPGELLFFKRGTVHAQPKILEGPVVFLAIDTPRRDPKDIVFVNPEDGTPESFIRAVQQRRRLDGSGGFGFQAECFDSRRQSRRFHAKQFCGTSWAGNLAICLGQSSNDAFTLTSL